MNPFTRLLALFVLCASLLITGSAQEERPSSPQSSLATRPKQQPVFAAMITSTRLTEDAVSRLLSEADPQVSAIPVVKAFMKYRNSGGVSCHTDDAKIAERHFKKTKALTTEDATRIVRAYLDCTRERGIGPAIPGIGNPKGYVVAIDKKLQGSTDDSISTMAAAISDIEAALDQKDYIQALVDYESLRNGSSAARYRRVHSITGADIGTNRYTRQPAFSWTPSYWANIDKEADDLIPDDVFFVRDYLQQTTDLAQDLRAAVETEARLTVAVSADPTKAKSLCDSAEELVSRIYDTSIHDTLSSRLAAVRKSQQEREKLLTHPSTLDSSASSAQSGTAVTNDSRADRKPPTKRTLTVYKGQSKWRAERIAAKLREGFLPAFVISRSQDQRQTFEVQVGPVATEAEASFATERITKAGFTVLP